MNKLAKVPDGELNLPKWSTEFVRADLRALTKDAVLPSWSPGEARPRLISRSGFERKHIHTSQIASG